MKYEISKDRDEILKTISESKNRDRNILWQNHNDHRDVFEIFNIEIDPIQEILRFNVLDPTQISSDLNIYIKLNHRNMIFKGHIISVSANEIFVRIPDEIKLEELRAHKRFKFESSENRKVILSFDSSFSKTAKEHLPIQMLDVSQSGLGIIVNYFDKEKLLNSQNLSLSHLGHFEFKSFFHMNPVYKASFNPGVEAEEKFKIGYKFEEHLPDNLIENFVRAEEGIFAHELGFLGKSRKFQKKLHSEYRQMVKKLDDKKEFHEFFASQSGFTNIGYEYLPKHIRLLSMFSCALAKLININNQVTTRQLTYISFVHDIAFFNNPKLAQIRNGQHFEKVKFLLNASERELYFRSASYAHRFAIADPHAPAGAENILHQIMDYRVSEDKEFFLSQGSTSQLVAIFLIAHDLVDYVLTHPNWSFYEYLERYPFEIYGGTFLDIYEKLKAARIAA